ncbi:unnamed protein product [Closterium sp. NIES-64]|nr:unnamed protein product [Closterium sp. NIES-64]
MATSFALRFPATDTWHGLARLPRWSGRRRGPSHGRTFPSPVDCAISNGVYFRTHPPLSPQTITRQVLASSLARPARSQIAPSLPPARAIGGSAQRARRALSSVPLAGSCGALGGAAFGAREAGGRLLRGLGHPSRQQCRAIAGTGGEGGGERVEGSVERQSFVLSGRGGRSEHYDVIVIGAGGALVGGGSSFSAVEEGEQYDVIVIGAGHAGCEAALASARLGARTLLLTLSLDKIAWQVGGIEAWGGGRGMGGVRQLWRPPGWVRGSTGVRQAGRQDTAAHPVPRQDCMAGGWVGRMRGSELLDTSLELTFESTQKPFPSSTLFRLPLLPPSSASLATGGIRTAKSQSPCNPAVGGPAKSQLVHETDALGGEIGRMTDRCYVQKRVLNRSRGPAVWALRAHPHSSCTFPHPPHSSPPLPTPLLPLRCYMQKRVLNRLCWPIGCYVQKRVLNRSRGPAVWALRAQTDKREYSEEMRKVVEK